MSNPVSARRDGTNYVHSIFPDVCWTPIGDVMVPIPYSSICLFDEGSITRQSRTVRNNEDHDFQLNTRCTKTTGHEPGTGKGVIVPGYMQISHIMQGEGAIFSEGYAIVRNEHMAWMNRPDEGPQEGRRSSTTTSIEHI